ncbi:uncharacterized protein [Gossypium hirsutum]|uniref:Retrotransposon gag domain-containing protein n=1 Tax=Gossypium hirsutum TaxID=3635 RepID=A0A1U8PDH8_GOSHI|nr:uncharacterized protein LOC107957335 [Gossypium hirsutum]
MKPQGVTEDQIKLRAFPFSLVDSAREWLFYLPPESVNTWSDMSRLIFDRFFPAARETELRRDIVGIYQKDTESLYNYWERYKKLCVSCPQHGLTEQLLLQYFYEGLLQMEMKMIDAVSGGALVNMTPQRARELITMAANSQQFQPVTKPTRRVHGLSSLSLEDKIDKLTNVVQTLLSDKIGPSQLCGICAKPGHPTDSYPILQEDLAEQRPPQNQQIPHLKSSLEAIVERLANSTKKFQQKTYMHFQELDKQVSKLVLTVSRLESQWKLPSQTELNPRHNASALTLSSGKILEPVPDTSRGHDTSCAHDTGRDEKNHDTEAPVKSAPQNSFAVPPPFPGRLVQCRNEQDEKEILDTF